MDKERCIHPWLVDKILTIVGQVLDLNIVWRRKKRSKSGFPLRISDCLEKLPVVRI